MPKVKFSGPFGARASSYMTIARIAIATGVRHALGKKMTPDWDVNTEIGIRFWRNQFTKAMAFADMEQGRALFDSLQTETDDDYDVELRPSDGILGNWYTPRNKLSDATILYFHGGGYTFHAAMNRRFAQCLAHRIGARVFVPEYRLTPEHPHPAQRDDAVAAWEYVSAEIEPKNIVVIGDSAGGHMMLMLLQSLAQLGQDQPAMGIGLCPWTDIGERGESLHAHDEFDMVQGWMAVQFGKWLDPKDQFGRKALSPIEHDFSQLAPLYLQTGGREILHDMIVEFANVQEKLDADVMLDIWPKMPHDFQMYDSSQADSTEAIKRIVNAVQFAVGESVEMTATERTKAASGRFAA